MKKGKPWHHTLSWSTIHGEDISHTVTEDSDEQSLRMMIELCEVTIDRCRRELAVVVDGEPWPE